jgi:hypothetical protein
MSPTEVLELPVFWYEWAALAEAADNAADRENQNKAQSDRQYDSIKKQQ